jgi:hypothetical protein
MTKDKDQRQGKDRRVAIWSSAAWRAEALDWLDERLISVGAERSGEVEQPHIRPWATALRVPTTEGIVWLKACSPSNAFEVGIYDLLVRVAPERVLIPIATDTARGWVILPDGGSSLAQRLSGEELAHALSAALVQYGWLQRSLVPHLNDLLSLGVADMRPAVMPRRFDEALLAVRTSRNAGDVARGQDVQRRVIGMRETFMSWCKRLMESSIPPSLDHNDLHPWNILGSAGNPKFYDWGDSVVAHPFAAMLVPLGFVQRHLDADLKDPRFIRARDAYLDVFRDLAPDEDLTSTLETACRVAKIARVLTWHRAIQAADEQGEEIDDEWVRAPMDTLASVLDDSYLGGA